MLLNVPQVIELLLYSSYVSDTNTIAGYATAVGQRNSRINTGTILTGELLLHMLLVFHIQNLKLRNLCIENTTQILYKFLFAAYSYTTSSNSLT